MSTKAQPSIEAASPATPAAPDLEDGDEPDESLTDRVATALFEVQAGLQRQVAQNLAAGAVMLLVTLLIVLLAALVGGEFSGAIPTDSVFSEAISTTEDNAGTAFIIFGVSLLAIPAVSVLAYIVVRLGPFIGGGLGTSGGGDLMNRR